MGLSTDYLGIPDWVNKPEGYQAGVTVRYNQNIFKTAFWGSEPGVGNPEENGWRFDDELYDLTSQAHTQEAKIIAYIPTWRKTEGFDYANEKIYQNITHGIISFLMFEEKNLGEFTQTSVNDVNEILDDIVTTGHKNNAKILIALGGATDYGFLYLMEKIGNNPSDPLLPQTVNKVVKFINDHSLDGVDLDLECWWAKNPGDPDQGGRPTGDPHPAGLGLTKFAERLKQALPLGKTVSAAVFATSWYGNNYDPKLADYVEWIGVMSYDLTGASDKSPVGPHTKLFSIREQKAYTPEQQEKPWPALPERPPKPDDNPIISVEDSLWYWSNSYFVNWQTKGQGLPRNKLAFGVPTYGYDFAYKKDQDPQSHEIPPGYKVIQYKDIVRNYPYSDTAPYANIKELGSTPRPDFVSHVPGNYPYAHNIYFETPETAVEKLKFLKYVGVQGVIVWDITGDDWQGNKSIIKALYQAKDLPVDLSAISGFYTKKQQYPNVPVGVEKVSQAAPV
ncbi:MAG: glycoside hydrolase family 18 protein [Nostoc sp.]|uniref:glycoside hydrolase family 18 protein n=1 Tax=Nostoc sp. TaxID=1180 RepID=UPI002FF76B01